MTSSFLAYKLQSKDGDKMLQLFCIAQYSTTPAGGCMEAARVTNTHHTTHTVICVIQGTQPHYHHVDSAAPLR